MAKFHLLIKIYTAVCFNNNKNKNFIQNQKQTHLFPLSFLFTTHLPQPPPSSLSSFVFLHPPRSNSLSPISLLLSFIQPTTSHSPTTTPAQVTIYRALQPPIATPVTPLLPIHLSISIQPLHAAGTPNPPCLLTHPLFHHLLTTTSPPLYSPLLSASIAASCNIPSTHPSPPFLLATALRHHHISIYPTFIYLLPVSTTASTSFNLKHQLQQPIPDSNLRHSNLLSPAHSRPTTTAAISGHRQYLPSPADFSPTNTSPLRLSQPFLIPHHRISPFHHI